MKISRHAAAFFLPVAMVFAQTAPLPKGVQKVTSVEGITEYRLDNGLKVLLFPDQTKNTITVNITYLVGSRNENYGETGMAHLLEHLVFKGTPRHPDIPKELTSHGTRPNGTTWFDRTNYFETFAATDENLRWALDLESDRMVNSFIAKKDLDSEMTVVRNEFEMGENSPFGVLMNRTIATAFLWHNYGKSTIGSRADLENVPIDRLQAFYKLYYQPDNAVLLVAGKFEEPKTIELVNEYFGKIPKPTRQIQRTYTLDPVQDGERLVTVRRVGDIQLCHLAYHVPDGAHPDMAALDVLADILGRTPSGRLYKALVETKKAASVGGFSFQLKEPGILYLMTQLRKENSLDEARDIMLKTVEDFAATPPTDEEVDRSKTELLKQIDLTLNDNTRVGLSMSEPVSAGDWRLFFLHRDRIKTVKTEDVLRVAKTYLKPANRTMGLFIPTEKPDRSEIPPPSDVISMLKDYKGGEVVAQGEAFDPSVANVSKRTVKGTLGNGMKLVFVPKENRGNKVNAVLSLHFGDLNSLTGKGSAPGLAGSMLMRGTSKRTRQQITDELNRLKAQVSVFGGATGARVNIEAVRENLPAVMNLVAEILKDPSFPANEFDQLKQQQLAGQEQMRREPQAVAMSALQQKLNPYDKNDPRYVRTPDETIAALQAATLDEAKQFYKDFYGASTSELAIVGDFDPEQMQTLASKLFGDWKSPKQFAKLKYPYQKIAPENKTFETPDKANAMMGVGMPIPVGDEHQDYPALLMGNYILGAGMGSRLFARVRGKEGLSYNTGSMLMARPKEESGLFMAYAIYAPQNGAKVEAGIKDEIVKLVKEGVTEAELAEAKKGWLQGQSVSRAQDNELAGLLTGLTFEDRDVQFQGELEKKVAALSVQQIGEALRRHLKPEMLSFYQAGDFKKGAAQ
jgi:zinc protease